MNGHNRPLVEDILDALGRHPEREAVVVGTRRITAGEFRATVYRIARALLAQGLGRGDVVALLSGNAPETGMVRLAAALIGCPITFVRSTLSLEIQATLAREVGIRALVVAPQLAERAAQLLTQIQVENVLLIGACTVGVHQESDLMAAAARESPEPFACLARPEDISLILNTGGTTGRPKGACYTVEQMASFAERVLRVWKPGLRLLVCTAFAMTAGHAADYTLATSGTVVLQEDFDPAAVLEAIESERITHVFLPPPLLHQLLDHPDLDNRDTSSLLALIYGSCQPSPARLAEALRRFGPVLLQFYGQTEIGVMTCLTAEEHRLDRPELLRTAGRPVPGVRLAIRDSAGRDLPPGEIGEIWAQADAMMQGYWKRPDLTAAFLRDGWLRTGDLGHLDTEGYLTIVGRPSDIINRFEGRIFAAEVEDQLNSHPDVQNSAVFGASDGELTERLCAAVVRAPDGTAGEAELREFLRGSMGSLCEPDRIVFLPELPLTDAGKPDKRRLRREAEAALL